MISIVKYSIKVMFADGSWTSWSEWSDCSVPECGGGIRTRNRSCEDPPPEPGGKNCPGDKTDEERCNEAPCPGKSIS